MFMNTGCNKIDICTWNNFNCAVVNYTSLQLLFSLMLA